MSPPSVPRNWKIALAAFYVLFFLYALLVRVNPLLGVVVPGVLIGLWYLAWRGWRAFRMHEQRLEDQTRSQDPVEALKQRYAAGELSEAEFERELEQLLEDSGADLGESEQSVETLTEEE